MTLKLISTKEQLSNKQQLVQSFTSFCLMNNIPMRQMAHILESLNNELSNYINLDTYQLQQIIIKYLPQNIAEIMNIQAMLEGKSIEDIIFEY